MPSNFLNSRRPTKKSMLSSGPQSKGQKEIVTIPIAATQLLKRKSRYLGLSAQLVRTKKEFTFQG